MFQGPESSPRADLADRLGTIDRSPRPRYHTAMDTADTPRPRHELARLTELPPALRAPLPAASSTPSSTGGGLPISPRLVLRGLARHWWQALILWVVGSVGLGALVFLKYKPTYKSTSQVLVRVDSANPYVSTQEGKGLKDPTMQSQILMITSPSVLSAVASDSKVSNLQCVREASDPEAFLRGLIKVNAGKGNSTLIELSAETRKPEEAETIVNAVVNAFLETNRELATARNRQAITELEDHLKHLEDDIEIKKKELYRITKESEFPDMILQSQDLGIVETEIDAELTDSNQNAQMTVGTSEYKRLHQELLKLEYDEIEARAELETIRRQAAGTDPRDWVERRIEQAFLSNEDVRSLREALRDVDLQHEDALRRVRNPGDPALRRLKTERDRLAERYKQLWADLEPALRAQLANEETNPAQLVRQAEERLQSIQYRKKLVYDKFEAVKLDERSRGETSLTIGFLRTELAQTRGMMNQVLRRLASLKYDSQGGDIFQQISPAKAGKIPLVNKRDKLLAVSPLAMLGLVLGLVTLVEMRSGRVSGADDLTGRLSAEIFSVPPLPTVRSASRARLEGPGPDPKFEQFVQQLDHVRVALCGEETYDGRGRCVLITSAVGGEGKTTLAAQLAVRCAEAGSSTVLIDADLRRATLGRLFEVPDCPGLSDVLRGDATLEDALVPINQVGGCQLLPAGSPEANPNRILRGKNFAPMLERLRRTFDVVIIDTSPVLPVPDALILGRMADGAVLATRHDQSRFPAVERANSLLAGAGIPVLGVVVNGAKPSGSRGAGGNYYAAYSYRSDRMPDGAEPPEAG